MNGRNVNKPICAAVRSQATALFSLPMRICWTDLIDNSFERIGLRMLTMTRMVKLKEDETQLDTRKR